MKKILVKIRCLAILLTMCIIANILINTEQLVYAAVDTSEKSYYDVGTEYYKSITIPLDYHNFRIDSNYDNKEKYASYFRYDIFEYSVLPSNSKISVKYDKSIIDVKVINAGKETYLGIKAKKKGTSNLRIWVSGKKFHTYSITTKISVVDKGKTIKYRLDMESYGHNDSEVYHEEIINSIIKEMELENKSLYEKITLSVRWIYNHKQQFDSEVSPAKLFNAVMNKYHIPCYSKTSKANLVLMNDEKWYLIDFSGVYFYSIEDIRKEITNYQEIVKYNKENSIDDPTSIEELKFFQEIEKNGDAGYLTSTLISPYTDSSVEFEKNTKVLGKPLATHDILTDPDVTQTNYTGNLTATFSKQKYVINLLHSYKKRVALPMELGKVSMNSIDLLYDVEDEIVLKNNQFYIIPETESFTIIKARAKDDSEWSDRYVFDRTIIEIIEPKCLDFMLQELKIGKSFRLPLVNAEYSDFYITSNNSKVASVSANGVVKPKSKGFARITLTSKTNKNFKLHADLCVDCDSFGQ